jgi:hypothetical protein
MLPARLVSLSLSATARNHASALLNALARLAQAQLLVHLHPNLSHPSPNTFQPTSQNKPNGRHLADWLATLGKVAIRGEFTVSQGDVSA